MRSCGFDAAQGPAAWRFDCLPVSVVSDCDQQSLHAPNGFRSPSYDPRSTHDFPRLSQFIDCLIQ
jgi:hypothetical protein